MGTAGPRKTVRHPACSAQAEKVDQAGHVYALAQGSCHYGFHRMNSL